MDFDALNQAIADCRQCPRLVEWRELVAREKRKSYQEWTYWGRAVPNFGDPDAKRLIVGLAPAAHGANRTGRMFTGDRSGEWLYRALQQVGLANQGHSEDVSDGLRLNGTMITAVCHCAPPDNKPTPEEVSQCSGYLKTLLDSREWSAILCLGGIAWNAIHRHYGIRPVPAFGHGMISKVGDTPIFSSYHPSQQNTFTGRLTEEMLRDVMQRFAEA